MLTTLAIFAVLSLSAAIWIIVELTRAPLMPDDYGMHFPPEDAKPVSAEIIQFRKRPAPRHAYSLTSDEEELTQEVLQ